MASIAADHEIGMNFGRAIGRLRHHAPNAAIVVDEVGSFVLHAQVEAGKRFALSDRKFEKVPLRHQRDELAVRRQAAEIGGLKCVIAETPPADVSF